MIIGLVGILFIEIAVFSGCKKQAEPAESSQGQTDIIASAAIEQKMCPVMPEMKINPEVFSEYKGKKVYFCCTDCKAKFEAEPEKYIANLPQFKN